MILEMYYVDRMSVNAIAIDLGVSEARVCQYHTGALARLTEEDVAALAEEPVHARLVRDWHHCQEFVRKHNH